MSRAFLLRLKLDGPLRGLKGLDAGVAKNPRGFQIPRGGEQADVMTFEDRRVTAETCDMANSAAQLPGKKDRLHDG